MFDAAVAAEEFGKEGADKPVLHHLFHDFCSKYVCETISPSQFVCWSQDVFGNQVLISSPGPVGKPPPHVEVGSWRSVWFCVGD